ncbi:nucleolar protein dao-5 isoform X2 [Eupeodes corollae]|uniref:nucleolar protein dao-5 isoform X2 n=1 Tax=Eupeodes corollae TaxID=290404 RepID=UPI0024922863|nr:nucleolar protein dao-5 isoform X2 [Eupeodes corollae]
MAKCCVRGCSNKLEVGSKIRMFRFPALLDKPKSLVELSRQRRNAWLIALNRTNLPEEVLKSIGICSEHFVTGSPARLKDNTEVDWIPTVKMGNQQRNRNEKKIISPSQTTKLKRISSIEKLSELEKLKNELKCKDAIIKNYKDESLQLKDQQKKERGVSMRSGRILHKSTSKHKLIKRCVVRIRKIFKVKEEPEDEEFTPQSLAPKKSSSKEILLRNRTSKEHSNQEHVSRNPTPLSLKSKGSTNTRLSNSPNPSINKSEDPVASKTASKKIDEYFTPRTITKKLDEPHPIKPISRKLVEPLLLKSTSKKGEERVSPKLGQKKLEESSSSLPTKANSKKAEELRTPKASAKKVEEPVTAMASTRTRRAPKPNPKYANDDIITPKSISRREKEVVVLNEAGLDDSDAGDDFFYGGMGDTSETGTNDNISEAFEDNDSSDFSENGGFLLKRKRVQRPASFASRSNTPLAKRSRPHPKVTQIKPATSTPATTKSVDTKKVTQLSQMSSVAQPQPMANRKRKLEEQEVSRKEAPESIIARNKRLNIALYDANVARPSSPGRKLATKQPISEAQSKAQPNQVTNTVAAKRQMPGPLCSKIVSPSSTVKEKANVRTNSPSLQSKSPSFIGSSPKKNDSASTQDDFETMPTFTIVNINDIINKKGDCLVQKRSDDEVQEISSPNSMNRSNRRKTGHTTILSEKIDPVKLLKPLPKSPFPPIKKTVLQSNTITQTKSQQRISLPPVERKEVNKSLPVEKTSFPPDKLSPNKDKPAPRILNSVVAKKTFPVQPILSKLDSDLEREPIDDAAEKSVMVKENVGANKVVPSKPAQVRKLPAEKVCVQRQGNKLIKKITCFETWYVINIPETQELIVKNLLDIPLITLSNAVKAIKLPSASWSSKVSLYKLSAQMVNKANLTPYTGEISDQSIKEEDRDKYQPSCVMFRRMTQKKSQTRMPYDRAVIFKMKTFFTNIDGKNVRLIGAPSKISSFKDIEVLLELVDELDLLHEFVETASTV